MNENHRYPTSVSDEVFAEAVDRIEAGESLEQVLASYPPTAREELFEMLSIIQVAQDIRHDPIPRPSQARRTAAKESFLAAAARMRDEEQQAPAARPVTAVPPVTTAAPRPKPVAAPARPATRRQTVTRRASLWEQMVEGLQTVFSNRALRLAPLIVTLAIVLFSTSTLVTLAQTAVPGDLAYTFKQWIRKQELQLASPDRRASVLLEQERELAEDVAKAAERADQNSALIRAEDTQIYYGRNGRLLEIGGLTVMDRYQPDANAEVFKAMDVVGDLQPGALVQINYQILPGQTDTVQGISLTVVAPPTETPAAAPDTVRPQVVGCTPVQPEGWVPYEVKVGDNLTFLANRGGATVARIVEANCLDSETILIGAKLYVPAGSLKTDVPVLQCGSDRPKDWVLYEVQPGDNLTVIAERSGATVADVMAANCLDTDTILIGAKLYIPAATPEP
jgi:LysM repeat protein